MVHNTTTLSRKKHIRRHKIRVVGDTSTKMNTSAPALTYQPLKREHDIRLLHLEPGQFNDNVKCTLHHVNMGERPPYIALSYVWGDAAVRAPILRNGTNVCVTASLANALRRLREPDRPVTVWADALCINQGDIAERSSQVGIMAEIYKNAHQVVVYLGEDTKDTAMAFSLLREIYSLIESEPDPNQLLQAFNHGYTGGESSIIPPRSDAHWAALVKLFRRGYFARIWVIQEVALSRADPHVICGSHRVSWNEMMRVVIICSTPPNAVLNNGVIKSHSDCAMNMDRLRNDLCTGPGAQYATSLTLIQLLRCTSRSRATDPRDKLFALYGLANDIKGQNGLLLKADYAMKLRDVLISVMEFFISKEQGFQALGFAGLRDDRTEALPSWVPDWSIPVTNPLDSRLGAPGYNASGGRRGQLRPVANGTALELSLGATTIGAVKSVFALHKDHITIIPEFRQPGVLRRLWTDIVAPLGTNYCHGGNVSEAFWRTLIANKDRAALPAGPEFRGHFLKFWVENGLADLRAQALGRTSNSPHISDVDRDKDYGGAGQRVADSHLSNPDLMPAIRDDPFVVEFLDEPITKAKAHEYVQNIGMTITNRSFIVTEEGAVGLAPAMTVVGDVVTIIAGADTPFVLRPVPGEMGRFELFGEAYIHGVMGGEAVASDDEGESRRKKIAIV
ncbi:heterokaryon incompatibility protein-domain-containing protein [Immersiella caudata]|uniref:Heterokaryon incompatibility protein-domain-containing protein n=1 Tax=Immersiella caudata TaxID=314043 RepID=A0AA39WYG9_9PEZI|nr:heterokaryon incompatibility protein-domain-containing protein [Immersiella caudata]